MKRYIAFVLAVLIITACGKDDVESVAEVWKRQNEQAFNNLANNPEYTELKIPGGTNIPIYYRVLQKGEGKKQIFFNSQVEVYYKGWFVATNKDMNIKTGDIFEKRLFEDGTSTKFTVNRVVEGWGVALQYMVEGDKWEIWVPYKLGYGERGSDDGHIPGYSTLAFEIEVIKTYDPNTL